MTNRMKRIPISAGKLVANEYGYDQVVIMARKVGEDGGEHVTTYGVTRVHCDVAARIGNWLKYSVMKWPSKKAITLVDEAWQNLLDKDDRTSPLDYPDMCMITKKELADAMKSMLGVTV